MLPPTIPNEPMSRSPGEFDVHRARAPAVDTGLAPEHLVEQRLRVDAERERVAVSAVRRRDPVALLEDARDAGRDRFLPGVQVRRPVDLAREEERLDELLEAPDEEHPTVDPRVQVEVVEDARRRLVADATHAAPTLASAASRSAR